MSRTVWMIACDYGHIRGMVASGRNQDAVIKLACAGSKELLENASYAGADEVYWYEETEKAPAESFGREIAERIAEDKPAAVLSLDDPVSRTIWAQAVVLTGAAAVGTLFELNCGEMNTAKRLVADGRSVETVQTKSCIAGIFDGDDAEPAETPSKTIKADTDGNQGIRFSDEQPPQEEATGLKTAKFVVGAGMGVGSKADLELIREFAAEAGAEIGCSLPVARQLQWFDEHLVIGITHNRIAPDLYIALGVSGQPQHMSGVRDAKIIVGINTDPDAPIFKKCTYGIIGNVSELLPVMLEKAKK